MADLPGAPDEDPVGTLHWKTKTLVATADGRPFAWLDDELTDLDRASVAAHHPGRALLHRVDSVVGLTGADLTIVEDWLRDLAAGLGWEIIDQGWPVQDAFEPVLHGPG